MYVCKPLEITSVFFFQNLFSLFFSFICGATCLLPIIWHVRLLPCECEFRRIHLYQWLGFISLKIDIWNWYYCYMLVSIWGLFISIKVVYLELYCILYSSASRQISGWPHDRWTVRNVYVSYCVVGAFVSHLYYNKPSVSTESAFNTNLTA